MKKLFTFVSALALSAFAFAATTVEMNFSDPAPYGYETPEQGKYTQVNNGDKISKDNVDLVILFTEKNGFRFYSNQNSGQISLRGYEAAKMKIAAPAGKKLLKIKVSGSNFTSTYLADDSELKSTSWEGEKDTVLVSIKKSTVYFDAMTITYGDPGETPEVEKLDTIGVKAARERIDAGKKGACYIKGVVAGDPFDLGNNGPAFYMTDIESPTDSLEAFKINKDAKTPYANVDSMSKDIAMGDTILIYADGLDLYKAKMIYETTGGYFCETLGKFIATELDWAAGEAMRHENHWELSIAKRQGGLDSVLVFNFASDKDDAIGGFHYLDSGSITINKVTTALNSGTIQLTYKEQASTGYNTYITKVKVVAGDEVYVLYGDVEVYALDENYDEIDLVGDRPYIPEKGDTLTCAEAREYTLGLSSDTDGDTIIVHGFVTKIINTDKIYNTFWMDDEAGTKETFEVAFYKELLPLGAQLNVGDEVIATGVALNYKGSTPEIKNASVKIISGSGKVTIIEVTVAQALDSCMALEPKATSDNYYAITGFIIKIAREYDAEKGNISFWMSDNASDERGEFEAYNVKCDAELAAKLLPGAKVKVTDKLKHFYQEAKPAEGDQEAKPERHVYETLGGGSVEIIAGAGVEDIVVNVNATKFIYEGQLYILRDNAIYNVQGQRVK